MSRIKHVPLASLLFICAVPTTVYAQVGTSLTQGAALPVSLMAPSGAISTETNPAALSDLDGWALTYAHQETPADSLQKAERDALWLAASLGSFGGLGAGFDVVRPADGQGPDHGTLVFSGALGGDPRMSFGSTWRIRLPRGSGSPAHTADLVMMAKPSRTLALMMAGQNLAVNGASLVGQPLPRRGVLGIGVRPLADARWTLEMLGALAEDKDYSFRGQSSFFVPKVGELLVAGELNDRAGRQHWLLSAGARVVFGNAAVGGALLSNGGFDELGWSVWADMVSRPRPGVPRRGYVAEVDVEGGARGLPRTIRRMEKALLDPDVVGVVVKPSSTGLGLSAAQELRLAIAMLERAGKPVYCFLETASGPEYYACAGASRVTLDPAGNIRLMGVASESLLLGDLLRRVGLRADFVRIGRYKSAPEQWTNRTASEGSREQRAALLDDAYLRLTTDLAKDLQQSREQVQKRIDAGPFTAQEALDAGLVQATLDMNDLQDDARALFGDRVSFRKLQANRRHHEWGPSPQIGVVLIDGTIVDGENVDLPFVGVHMSGGRTISDTLDQMASDSRIKAIVVRVDSPGGAVMASDQIWRAVQRASKKKPVVASMGAVAASGGYYVASAADEIWAAPSTVTGSIGIFYGKIDAANLAERLDVGIEQDARGAHAGAESLFRPFTPEERATLATKLRFWYRQFLERVAEGRDMEVTEVDALARGRVYSGDRAKDVGLVDGLGGFNSALARARELAGIDPQASLVVRPERPSTLLDYVLGADSVESRSSGATLQAAGPWIEGMWLLGQLSGKEPAALWEGPTQLH